MSLATLRGIELLPEMSALRLGERTFPAAVAIDPSDSGWWGGAVNMDDPEWVKAWSVFVPMENGALVCVTLDAGNLDLRLHGRVWLNRYGHENDLEIAWGYVVGRRIVITLGLEGPGSWSNCEPEWAAEHIARLSTFPVVNVKGERPVTLRPFREALHPMPVVDDDEHQRDDPQHDEHIA